MAFTYNETLATDLDKVRFALGDTDKENYHVSDDEINAVLGLQADINLAAAALADHVANKFAANATFRNLSLQVNASDRYKHFKDLADRLRKNPGMLPGGAGGGLILAEMFVGGSSRDSKSTKQSDDSLTQPTFSRGIDDAPGNSGPDVVNDDGSLP